jgi:N-acetylneuraminate synthase
MRMAKAIQIAGIPIGLEHPPFIVAEMSGNHNHSLDRALRIVEAAAESGARALKLQTYTPDTMTIDCDEELFRISGADSPWREMTLYELYSRAHTPWEWHEAIFKRCHELGLICFSTVFDETAVDFLESLNAPCYKISSFENIDLPLIAKTAGTGKPVIVSTGMSSEEELVELVQTLKRFGSGEVVLLKCTSAYPAYAGEINLRMLNRLRERFKVEVGLSDHTMGIGVSVAGVALGAVMIEKHFTLSRKDGGVDASFSMEPLEMKQLAAETRNAWEALGEEAYGPSPSEKASMIYRRSLFVVEDIKKGDVFTGNNVRSIRPGFGLLPKKIGVIMGKKAALDVKRGTPLSESLILKDEP